MLTLQNKKTRQTGIVILDGPDASGKSVLADAFADMYHGQIIHLTYNKDVGPVMFDYQTDKMMEAIEESQEHLVIVDRHWMSENIYANTFRGGSPWPLMGRMMDRVWMKQAAIHVVCLPDNLESAVEMHRKNMDASHPYEDDKFRELASRYRRFVYGCHKYKESDYVSWYARQGGILRHRFHDFTPYYMTLQGKHLDIFCSCEIERLRQRQNSQYVMALKPSEHNILGHIRFAKYLFIGEQVNNKGKSYNWPFYEYGNSSLYLTEALQEINFHEDLAMWTNAKTPDNYVSQHIPYLIKHGLKPICFGKVAGDITAKVCFDYRLRTAPVTLEHPAHASRFANDFSGYCEVLKEALTID